MKTFGLWMARFAAVGIGLLLIFTFVVANAATPPPVLTISAIIDKTWVDQVGAEEAVNWTRDTLIETAAIYSQQTGVELQVTDVSILPIYKSSHPLVLLTKTKRLRSASTVKRHTGITIFFTNRHFEIGSHHYVGWSSGEDLYSRYSAAVISFQMEPAIDPYVVAHEIGHSFGLPHDGIDECAAEPESGYIMESTVGFSTQFSPCSVQMIKQAAVTLPRLTETSHSVQSLPRIKNSGAFDGTILLVLSIFTLYMWITRRLR